MNFKKVLACTLSASILISMSCVSLNTYAAKNSPEKKTHQIFLKSAILNSDENNSSFSRDVEAKISGKEIKPYIISFTGPITDEMKNNTVDSGVKLIEYIPDFSFLSLIPRSALDKVRKLDFVSAVIPYGAQYKIAPELMSKIKTTDTKGLEKDIKINVVTFDDTNLSTLDNEINRKGASKISHQKGLVTLKSRLGSIQDFSKLDNVKYIEEVPELKLDNDIARGIIGSESIAGLDCKGSNQIVGVADTGLDTGIPGLANNTLHADFTGRVNQIIDKSGEGTNGIDSHGHGTHVSGSILGSGQQSEGKIKGLAPEANLIMQQIANANGDITYDGPLYDLYMEAYTYGARIHSNSWSSSTWGAYTELSNEVDRFLWDYKDMTILFSSGNNGELGDKTTGSPSTAKNCITVGATENFRPYLSLSNNPDDRASFSSYGCNDGRIKPDVVAPGANIASTLSSCASASNLYPGNPYYRYMSGTSMSTPITAGAVAVIREYIQKNYSISNPSAALIKAFVINGALTQGYTNDEGFGKVSLYDSLQPTKIISHTSTLQTGQNITYSNNCTVADTTKPLKITLVWTDYPAALTASRALVNDLDLKVTSPNGSVYNGNDMTSPYNSEIDRTNNVETVIINAPQAGTYEVEVTGYNVPNGPQPFALVYSSDSFSVPRNLRATPTTSSITVGWDAVPGATGYDLEIDGATTLSITDTSYTHSGLVKNTQYKYRVRAKNSTQTGEWSNTLYISTTLDVPDVTYDVSNYGISAHYTYVDQAEEYYLYVDNEAVDFKFPEFNPDLGFSSYEKNTAYNVFIRAQTDFNYSSTEPVNLKTLDSGISYKSSMNTARTGFGAVASKNGKIYVMGGNNGPYLNSTEEYDPATDTWTNKAPMPATKMDVGAAEADNGKIYVIGGYVGSTYLQTVHEYDPVADTWTARANMPTARSGLGVCTVNGKIYAIGGFNGTSPLNTVEIYDPATNTWTTGASMPTPRNNFGISVVNGKIIVAGGANGANSLKTVEEYDPASNTWLIRNNMINPNSGFAMSELNGKLYASGGKNSNFVEEYEPVTGLWTTKSQLPANIYGHSSVAQNGKIYILGGYDGSSYYSRVIEYNTQKDDWTRVANMNYPREFFGSAEYNGKIYAFGGYGGKAASFYNLNLIEEYDTGSNTWTTCGRLSNTKSYTSAVTLNNKIYVCGGGEENPFTLTTPPITDIFSDMEEFDPVSKTCTQKAPMPSAVCLHELAALDGSVYVIGGFSGVGTLSTNVYKYNPSSNTWSTVAPLNTPRANHTVAVANGKIYVIGGYTISNGTSTKLTSIEEYNPATNTWAFKEPMPASRLQAKPVTINDKIYLIGGYINNTPTDEIAVYDPVNDSWLYNPCFIGNSTASRAVFTNNKIYSFGGIHSATNIGSTYVYDDIMTTLSVGSTVMEPRSGRKSIPVSISNVPSEGIYKAQVVIQYDPSKLMVTSAAAGQVIPEGYGFTYTADNTLGKVTITFTGDTATQKLIKTDGIFSNVEFDVLDSVGTVSSSALTLDRDGCILYKTASYQYTGLKLNNGSADIFIYGDVNGSSSVTQDDCDLIRNYLLGSIYCFPYEYGQFAADVNGDGQVNTFDMALILQYIRGQITKFPVQI